ncbi:hypothetical protein ACFX14_034302 [Malus domestica]
MAALRNLAGDARRLPRDEENAKEDDWSIGKKLKSERFPLSWWELVAALTGFRRCCGLLYRPLLCLRDHARR